MSREVRGIVLVTWHLACPQSFKVHAEGTKHWGDNKVTLGRNANAVTSMTMVWTFTSYTFILVTGLHPLLHNTPVRLFFGFWLCCGFFFFNHILLVCLILIICYSNKSPVFCCSDEVLLQHAIEAVMQMTY